MYCPLSDEVARPDEFGFTCGDMMCGLAGILSTDGSSLGPDADPLLRAMAGDLTHRGPDDEQLLREGPLGLAFRRLSIIDVKGGRQPLRNEDGSLALVLNGEIFNHRELARSLGSGHRFGSRSDAEIVLHLYEEHGPRCVEQLVGMFALALWDAPRRRLVLARDRFGIKPLFCARTRGRLLFSSEIKALLRAPDCPRTIDWAAALGDSALTGSLPLRREPIGSWFVGIEHIPAATIVEIDARDGQRTERTYWRPHADPEATGLPAALLVERYRERFEQAVHDCLMSDVELGVFLSGGVDSSAVLAVAATRMSPHTFTVLSRSTLGTGDARHAALASARHGCANHQVILGPDELRCDPDRWKSLLWLCETPLCGPEQLYKHELHRYAKAVRPDLKVILTGQGSDEFNGGYTTTFAGRGGCDAFLGALAGHGRDDRRTRSPVAVAWDERLPVPVLRGAFVDELMGDRGPTDVYDAYIETKHRDLQMYNCWHEDRTAAGCGIESRLPFLDHRLVELSLAVSATRPDGLLWDKTILRKAVAGLVGPEIAQRPKIPFFYGPGQEHSFRPILDMLAAGGGAIVEEAFSGRAGEIVDRDAALACVNAAIDEPGGPTVDHLLRLVNLGLLDRMASELPHAPSLSAQVALPTAVMTRDWDADEAEIRARLVPTPPALGPDAVLALAESVSILHAPGEQRWYLAVDGELVSAIDDDASWPLVLIGLDGSRSLHQICSEVGGDEVAAGRNATRALSAGLVQIVGSLGMSP